MERFRRLHLRLIYICFVCSGLHCYPTLLGPALKLGSLRVSLMCQKFVSMCGGLLHLPTCIGSSGRLFEPRVRIFAGVCCYCSPGFTSTFRDCVELIPPRHDVGAPLAGRWDDVRLGPHSGSEGQ
ncbi:hypothetical protein LINGRAHAP2_LOCUS24378 [Linum grandiflorum]